MRRVRDKPELRVLYTAADRAAVGFRVALPIQAAEPDEVYLTIAGSIVVILREFKRSDTADLQDITWPLADEVMRFVGDRFGAVEVPDEWPVRFVKTPPRLPSGREG